MSGFSFSPERYQRGSRSLTDSLLAENPALSQNKQLKIEGKETDDYEIPDEIEEVIGNF